MRRSIGNRGRRDLSPVTDALSSAIATAESGSLDVEEWEIFDHHFDAASELQLRAWKSLTALDASSTPIQRGGGFQLTRMNLRHILLSQCASLSDEALRRIGVCCPLLQTLRIAECRHITSRGLDAVLPQLKRLKLLDIAGCQRITACDGFYIALQRCTSLRLRGNVRLSDAILSATVRKMGYGLYELPPRPLALVEIDLGGVGCCDRHIEQLVMARLSGLKWLSLAGSSALTPRGFSLLHHAIKQLRYISLAGCIQLVDESLEMLPETIEHLNVSELPLLTYTATKKLLGRLSELQSFSSGGSFGKVFSNREVVKFASIIAKQLFMHTLCLQSSALVASDAGFIDALASDLRRQRIKEVDNAALFPTAVAEQASAPDLCNRSASVAINGDNRGIFGTGANDERSTTTMTLLEKESWWMLDLGKPQNVGLISVILPEGEMGRAWCYPLWILTSPNCFSPRDSSLEGARRQASFAKRFDSNDRGIRCEVRQRIRYVRIQQEQRHSEDARLLPIASVRVFLRRLQVIDLRRNDNFEGFENLARSAHCLEEFHITRKGSCSALESLQSSLSSLALPAHLAVHDDETESRGAASQRFFAFWSENMVVDSRRWPCARLDLV